MDSCGPISVDVVDECGERNETAIDRVLEQELIRFGRKIVVLDDDPTGIQTVHDLSVYTDWSRESIREGFEEEKSMFFILTNSRAFTAKQTRKVHSEIAERIVDAAGSVDKDFLIISRADSTLRGHYPLETETLKQTLEERSGKHFDGEIICPFFREGGRFTLNNIHYVQDGNELIPVGQTEFANDKTFGFKSSNLAEWCEEKSGGRFPAKDIAFIPLELLRQADYDAIEQRLLTVNGFNKVIVNAVNYTDVKVFCVALLRAIGKGKEFLFRTAAALTKVIGGVPDKPLLTRQELVAPSNTNGGIILVGSHVTKTTQQLEELKKSPKPISFIIFNQHLVVSDDGLGPEIERVVALSEEKISAGETVAIYTRRDRFDLPTDDKELQLKISVEISEAVTSIIEKLSVQPNFIIAKGGITSSDVGIKGLGVRKALVMGQILPGVPVWMTGAESKFPGMPYIIFPGNVGTPMSLKDAVESLMS